MVDIASEAVDDTAQLCVACFGFRNMPRRVGQTPLIEAPPYVQEGLAKHLCRMWVLLVKAGLTAARMFMRKTPPQHAAVPANLKPPKGLGLRFGIGMGLGSGWSGPTCKVEIDDTHPAQSFVPTSPAHRKSNLNNTKSKMSLKRILV